MDKSSTGTHVDEFAGLLGKLGHTKTASESQAVFNEVLDQITAQEDDLGVKKSLYTLPSMDFLESLFDEMDSRNASNGIVSEPPLYIDVDSLELPGLEQVGQVSTLEELGLHSPSVLLQKPAYSCPAGMTNAHSGGFSLPSMGSTGQMAPMGHIGPINTVNTIREMIPTSAANLHNPFAVAPTAGSAAPSPVKRTFSKRLDEDDEDVLNGLEYSYETSKSGRCRKVSSFVSGKNKRKAYEMGSMYSAPANIGGRQSAGGLDINPYGPEPSEVASKLANKKGAKSRNRSKTTVCLNCGSMDTPQWRVGPLGPRTLCNACGVRYKKGLPLSCYPLRNGMVLPPGAVLPPSVIVPPGMNIVLQPLKQPAVVPIVTDATASKLDAPNVAVVPEASEVLTVPVTENVATMAVAGQAEVGM